MRLGTLDLNLLVALDRLLTHRSITKAGDEMHLTQSAMSSALRRLRDYFGDPLLVQVGRQLQLTPRAEALQRPVRDILVQIENAVSSGLEFDPSASGRDFRIVLSDYTLNVLAPLALALAAQENAKVRFRFLAQVHDPHLIIERGDADLLIAPGILTSPDHPTEELYSDRFVAVAWSEGRYGRGCTLDLDSYLAAKHILMVPPVQITTFQTDFMFKLGIQRDIDVECYSFAAMAPLVIGTDRIATVHAGLIKALAGHLPLTVHKLPFDAPCIVEHLQWHRHMTQDPALIWLRGLFTRAAAPLNNNAA